MVEPTRQSPEDRLEVRPEGVNPITAVLITAFGEEAGYLSPGGNNAGSKRYMQR